MNSSIFNLFLVAFGGAFGSVTRYYSAILLINYSKGNSFPLGTIFVNVVGSFLIGILDYIIINHIENLSLHVRLLLVTGFLGGFTTFSAFSLDIFRLIYAGEINIALSYIILSVILSIFAVYLGYYLTSAIFKIF